MIATNKGVRRAAGTLIVLMALGLVGPTTAHAGTRPGRSRATAVVSFIDTGINPYHKVFRDNSARAQKHPSTYLQGFPKSAQALRLTLNARNYKAAVKADCSRVWAKIKPGKLYWFPGTKTDRYFTLDRQAREALHQVFRGVLG